jgi:methionine synthase II (cobalamin-independent)
LKNNICFNLFSDKSKPKVDILDPFTFYDLSANEFYKSEEEAINAFADIIKKELNSIKKDIELIQFNAPSLARVKEKEQLDIIRKAMVKIVKGLDVTTCLNLWGSDVSDTLEAFQDFPVDIIGIDFTTSKIDKFDQIDINKGLACGLIDAKNTKMEKTSEIIRELKNIKELFKPTSLAVIPSWDFEFIPETFACKKLDIMKQIKEKTRVMKL